jgi:hypothetical protein
MTASAGAHEPKVVSIGRRFPPALKWTRESTMGDMFTTPFWRAMAQALPPGVRQRYLPQLKSAENFELMLDKIAHAWKSLAELLHFSAHRSAH